MKTKILILILCLASAIIACNKVSIIEGVGESGNTTATPANSGNLMVWTATNWGAGIITVTVNGKTANITSYFTGTTIPDCGAVGFANFTIPVGTYAVTAKDATHSWSGTGTVTSGKCTTLKLQ